MGVMGPAAGLSAGYDALEDIVADRELQKEMRARQILQALAAQQTQQRLDMDAQRFSADQEQQQYERGQAEQKAGRAERDATNQRGVLDLIAQGVTGGADPKALQAMALREGLTLPANLTAKEGGRLLRVPGPNGSPQARLVPDSELEQGVTEYQEPPTPPTPRDRKRVWVTRGGQVTPTWEGEEQPGDVPYDAVAARQGGGGGGPAGGGDVDPATAYAAERATRSIDMIDQLAPRVNRMTVGWGSLMAAIPESQATNFAADIKALGANLAFNELAEMRASNKTGGGLGPVSERELDLLTGAMGSLQTDQSPANMRKNLSMIRQSLLRWEQEKAKVGMDTPERGGAGPAANDSAAKARALIEKYRAK